MAYSKIPKAGSRLEEELYIQLRALHGSSGIPLPVREYRFIPSRKYRADFCWPEHKVICEVEGGVWTNGRHNRAKGFIEDCSKYNQATCLGYKVLRITGEHIKSGEAVAWIEKLVKAQT